MQRCCTREQTRWTPLGEYLRETRDHSLLSAEEEIELAHAVRRGDDAARSVLIESNLRLVIRIARDFEGRGLGLDDLVGEGNLGLIRAVSCYDPAFGTRFSTYAGHWIKQAIRQALSTTTATIRLPAHMYTLLTRWGRAERAHLQTYGQPASFEHLALSLGLSEAKARMVSQALLVRRLLPGSVDRDENDCLDDAADLREGPDAPMEVDDDHKELLRRFERLTDRERTFLVLRYGLSGQDEMKLREIGVRFGVTREGVRKIVDRALRKLRDDWTPPEPAPRKRSKDRSIRARQSRMLQPA